MPLARPGNDTVAALEKPMQHFLKWLGTLVFGEQRKEPAKTDPRTTNGRLRVAEARRRTAALAETKAPDSVPVRLEEFDADSELGSRIEDGGPGKNILRVREESGTSETLKVLDANILDGGDSSGFDPYNTGRFDRSANWSRHIRH